MFNFVYDLSSPDEVTSTHKKILFHTVLLNQPLTIQVYSVMVSCAIVVHTHAMSGTKLVCSKKLLYFLYNASL